MTEQKLAAWIDGLTQDITFSYLGQAGSICPFSRSNISLSYGDEELTFDSIEAVMETPFITNKALKEICEDIQFD